MKEDRLRALAGAMAEQGVDLALIASDLELFYYTDVYEESMERLRVLLVDRKGDWQCYANRIFRMSGSGPQAISHRDGEESEALKALAGRLDPNATIAIDSAWPSGFLLELQALAPGRKFCGAGRLLSVPMACKDKEELALMRRSSRINDQVVGELISSVGPASTETGLSQAICALYDRYGADGREGGALVAFGANCASPHPAARKVCPKPGDCIMIDAGAPYERYQSDMTRTVFFRDVSPEMERIYHIVLEANLAGIEAVRPGRTAGEIDRVCRQVIEKSGYGACFTHRTGHGIGLHLHEEPYISAGSRTVLREGMIFSIEPGIYVPGSGGVRIEDLVAVTADGAEVLNQLPKELRVLE